MWHGPFGYADGWSWFWPFHFVIPLLFLALVIMGNSVVRAVYDG